MSADEPAQDGPSDYPPPPRTPDIDPMIAAAAAATATAQEARAQAQVQERTPQGEKRPRSRGEGGALGYAQDHHHPAPGNGTYDEEERKRRREEQGEAARGVYTRTGQACDRCKARKIKCDALPGGCSPCATAGVECYVTDRVSGRTERRGYLQDLERERESMVGYIRDLERVIAEATTDVRVRPSPWTFRGPEDAGSALAEGAEEWEQVGAVLVRRLRARENA